MITKNEFGGGLSSKFYSDLEVKGTLKQLITDGFIKDVRIVYGPETQIATVYFTPVYELKKIQISFTIDNIEDPDKPSKGLYLL